MRSPFAVRIIGFIPSGHQLQQCRSIIRSPMLRIGGACSIIRSFISSSSISSFSSASSSAITGPLAVLRAAGSSAGVITTSLGKNSTDTRSLELPESMTHHLGPPKAAATIISVLDPTCSARPTPLRRASFSFLRKTSSKLLYSTYSGHSSTFISIGLLVLLLTT